MLWSLGYCGPGQLSRWEDVTSGPFLSILALNPVQGAMRSWDIDRQELSFPPCPFESGL